ncbi:MAG: hypothetical protein JO112_19785 [Planctomycetes bacterium]|nr:hypothetical protein [Planctomycetota bacterium]
MPEVLSLASSEQSAHPKSLPIRPGRLLDGALWFLLIGLLVINLPAFLCMGLDGDASLHDLVARKLIQAGIHATHLAWYETNLPGMVWLHVLVRLLLGWRSEMLRLADFVVVAGIVSLLVSWVPASPAAGRARLALAIVLFSYYFSMSEWCHCQRDVWMLLPALGALSLRRRQLRLLTGSGFRRGPLLACALLEGFLWGAAFWIKPFVAVPALCCWLLTACLTWRTAPHRSGKLLLDGMGVLGGGLLAGAAGCAWLLKSGAWPSFVQMIFVWNREYVNADIAGEAGWLYTLGFLTRFFPWLLVHAIAVPEALQQALGIRHWAFVRRRSVTSTTACERMPNAQCLMPAVFYLGWLFQAVLLQHLYDYVQVPPVLLGLAVVVCGVVTSPRPVARRLVLGFLLVCVLLRFPALCVERAALWSQCVREGSTASLRDRLRLYPKISYTDLEHVGNYLRQQDLKDGELTCFSMQTVPLYLDLNLKPSTNYLFLQFGLLFFSQHRDEMLAAWSSSPQRFLVCDLEGPRMAALKKTLGGGDDSLLDADAPVLASYPWKDRIVFRSGRYVVFRLSGPESSQWLADTCTY